MKRSGIVSKRLEYYLAHMNTYYIRKPDHFSFNSFARSKFCQIFYWIWRFYPLHKQTMTSSWSRAIISTYWLPDEESLQIVLIFSLSIVTRQVLAICRQWCCRIAGDPMCFKAGWQHQIRLRNLYKSCVLERWV